MTEPPKDKEADDKAAQGRRSSMMKRKKQLMYRRHMASKSTGQAPTPETPRSPAATVEKESPEAPQPDQAASTTVPPPDPKSLPLAASSPIAASSPSRRRKVDKLKVIAGKKASWRNAASPRQSPMPSPISTPKGSPTSSPKPTPKSTPNRVVNKATGNQPTTITTAYMEQRKEPRVKETEEQNEKTEEDKVSNRSPSVPPAPPVPPPADFEEFPNDEGGMKQMPTEKAPTEKVPIDEPPQDPAEEVLDKKEQMELFFKKHSDDIADVADDPPLEEMKSEISVATSGFDMRSIHDHPPSPPPIEEGDEKVDDGFDPSWDVSNTFFQTTNVGANSNANANTGPNNNITNNVDMFETDSWAKTSASFPAMIGANQDIEELAARLMKEQAEEMAEATQADEAVETTSEVVDATEAAQTTQAVETNEAAEPFDAAETNEAAETFEAAEPFDDTEINNESPYTTELPPPSFSQEEGEEEKKERETPVDTDFSQQIDTNDSSWDVNNVAFQTGPIATQQVTTSAPDMFDTSSWGNADTTFSVSMSKFDQHPDNEESTARPTGSDSKPAKSLMVVQEEQIHPDTEENTQAVQKNLDEMTTDNKENKTGAADGAVQQESTESNEDPATEEVIEHNYEEVGEGNEDEVVEHEGDEGVEHKEVAETKEDEVEEPKEKVIELKDDEPLLLKSLLSSDEGDVAENHDDSVPIDKRVEAYIAPNQEDEESSKEEVATAEQEKEEPDDDDDVDEEVKYIDQVSDDEKDEAVDVGISLADTKNVQGTDEEEVAQDAAGVVSAADAPTFDVAALAAEKAEGRPKIEVEGLHLIREAIVPDAEQPAPETSSFLNGSVSGSADTSLAGERFLGGASVGGSTTLSVDTSGTETTIPHKRMSHIPRLPPGGLPPPPPPPPPPAEKRTSRRNRSSSRGKDVIPLIPPPPEEKLKKWEDSQMRAQRYLQSLKAAKEAEELEQSSKIPEDLKKVAVLEISTDLDPEPYPHEIDVSLFSSPKSKTPRTSNEKSRTPNAGEFFLTDQKMAEKVALASSAAAVTFEQCLTGAVSPQSAASPGTKVPETTPGMGDATFVEIKSPGSSPPDGTHSKDEDKSIPEKDPQDAEEASSPSEKVQRDPPGIPPIAKIESYGGFDERDAVRWFCETVLSTDPLFSDSEKDVGIVARLLLEDEENFNTMCQYVSTTVNAVTSELGYSNSFEDMTVNTINTADGSLQTCDSTVDKVDSYIENKRPKLTPMVLSEESKKLAPNLIAANFVSFLYLTSKLTNVPSPFGDQNPFLLDIVDLSLKASGDSADIKTTNSTPSTSATPLEMVFDRAEGKPEIIMMFVYRVHKACEFQIENNPANKGEYASPPRHNGLVAHDHGTPSIANKPPKLVKLYIVPDGHPSPFEASVEQAPRIIAAFLSFLGDPVAVCRVKMVNKFCNRIVGENEHVIMQNAVRLGGLSMNVRPAFWMWIALEKCRTPETEDEEEKAGEESADKGAGNVSINELKELERNGSEGKWHHVIERDVARSFGNMPPHKTGARLRTDSIVRALVTWGQNRIMTRGVKGGGDPFPTPNIGPKEGRKQKEKPRRRSISSPPWECTGETDSVESEVSQTPTETVSDWGGVSPVGSFAGSHNGFLDGDLSVRDGVKESVGRDGGQLDELALSGNLLTNDMKVQLQNKLRFVLHSLAAAHEDVGYCQGMDYVVAHLLRLLQDTVKWKAMQGSLPSAIKSASSLPDLEILRQDTPRKISEELDKSMVVEETVFRVMDTFFTTYNLRHMYWPELRCLKTCCRVFERLIQIKLPVLADHFEHHDLNVGLFALGWFQTLFLYLPSMPSATVCHMWDIWLVERSFKIFFRVATAILFLSQPILLNHELEGMMTYLNTIPDATLLKPDILIACALNIKVTNRMLQELEEEVTREP